MRKTFITSIIVAIAAVMSVSSCQEGIEELNNGSNGIFKATATINNGTRVSYDVDDVNHKVSQTWEVGDKVVCADDMQQIFTFTVAEVVGGVATFDTGSYNPVTPNGTATKIYAVYYPVGSAKFVKSGTTTQYGDGRNENKMYLDCDLTAGITGELEDNAMRLVLSAEGEISGNSAQFTFDSECAIVALQGFVAGPNARIDAITLGGLASSGRFTCSVFTERSSGALLSSKIAYSQSGKGEYSVTFDEPLVCDASGNCNASLYFPVFPSGETTVSITALDETAGIIYKKDIPVSKVAASTFCYMRNKELEATVATNAASVNGVNYVSFAEAIEVANTSTTDCTFKLLEDITYTNGTITLQNAGDKKITLDLNGFKLDAAGGVAIMTDADIVDGGTGDSGEVVSSTAPAIYAQNGAKVTVYGGKYTSSYKEAVFRANNTGTLLTIKDGVIAENTNSSGRAVNSGNSSSTTAKIVIDGGSYTAKDRVLSSMYGSIEVNGGTFNGPLYSGSNSSASLTINGGYFNSGSSSILKGTTSKISIVGGYFSEDPSASVADGYITMANEDVTYAYKVVMDLSSPVVAEIDGVQYRSFQSAIGAANNATSDCTFNLTDNVTYTGTITLKNTNGKKITFNLGTYTLAATGGINVTGGSVAISGGNVSSTTAPALLVTGGQVDVSGGAYTSSFDKTIHAYNTGVVLTLTDVTASSTSTADDVRVICQGNGTKTTAVINIISGSYTAPTGKSVVRAQNGPITINGGTFSGVVFAYSGGSIVELNINDGYFSNGGNAILNQSNSKFKIKGGYFDNNTYLDSTTVPSTHEAVESGDTTYPWKVQAKASQSSIAPWTKGSLNYYNLK